MRLQLVRGYVWWAAWTSHSRLPGQLTVTPGQLTVLGMGLHRYTYAETGGMPTVSACSGDFHGLHRGRQLDR